MHITIFCQGKARPNASFVIYIVRILQAATRRSLDLSGIALTTALARTDQEPPVIKCACGQSLAFCLSVLQFSELQALLTCFSLAVDLGRSGVLPLSCYMLNLSHTLHAACSLPSVYL